MDIKSESIPAVAILGLIELSQLQLIHVPWNPF